MSYLHPDSVRLIERHGMHPHPEGGWFVEHFRSAQIVQPDDDREVRSAVTTILFLLDAAHHRGISVLHRVRSDEVWHHLGGDPLELVVTDDTFDSMETSILDSESPVFVVPADHWQSARTTGSYTLVGCTVGPGFDFEDFLLLRTDPKQSGQFIALQPALAHLV